MQTLNPRQLSFGSLFIPEVWAVMTQGNIHFWLSDMETHVGTFPLVGKRRMTDVTFGLAPDIGAQREMRASSAPGVTNTEAGGWITLKSSQSLPVALFRVNTETVCASPSQFFFFLDASSLRIVFQIWLRTFICAIKAQDAYNLLETCIWSLIVWDWAQMTAMVFRENQPNSETLTSSFMLVLTGWYVLFYTMLFITCCICIVVDKNAINDKN